jgi:hypothetical protein
MPKRPIGVSSLRSRTNIYFGHSFQEALTITMNTMKQLHVLSSSLKYVSDGLRENSPPVPVNKDVPVTAVLCKCIDAVIKSQEQLNLEMQALKEAVNQVRLIILWLVRLLSRAHVKIMPREPRRFSSSLAAVHSGALILEGRRRAAAFLVIRGSC